MPVRPVSFYLPSSSQIKIFFNKNLSSLSVNNFLIKSLTGTSQDLSIESVTVDKNSVEIKTHPQNARTYYLIELIHNETFPFKSEDNDTLIDDRTSRKIFFVGAEEFNPIRDRFFSSIPKIYDVNGTLIEDILSVQARSLREAQRAAGELLSDNYIRVEANDEFRVRSSTSRDKLANENCFKIKRVSRNTRGSVVSFKSLNYSNTNEIERHSYVNDIVSLKEETKFEKVILSKENILSNSLLLELGNNIIKLLSLKFFKEGELPDCDGNTGKEIDVNILQYILKDNRYDSFAKYYEDISDKNILFPFLSNTTLSTSEPGDYFEIEYLTKNGTINNLDNLQAYEVIKEFKQAIPSNSASFFLANSNIVNNNNETPNANGVLFFKNENSSEVPFIFSKEVQFGEKRPSSPGEFSVNYSTGEVEVFGLEGKGTGDSTYIAKYNYRRVLENNHDYYIHENEFVLNKKRSVINNNIFIDFQYENIFVEGEHYTDLTHIEKINEQVKNKVSTSFSLYTEKAPVSSIFRITNQTTGEVYNPLYAIDNKVYFSGNRSPELRTSKEAAKFDEVFQERLFENLFTIAPSFSGKIVSATNPSNVVITPSIPNHLIDESTTKYFLKEVSTGEEYEISMFNGSLYHDSVSLKGTSTPSLDSEFVIGSKVAVISLNNSGVLSKESNIGSIFSSSVKFTSESFGVEKFFSPFNSFVKDTNINISLLNSINSSVASDNIKKLRKNKEYGIDYVNGVVYVAVNGEEDFGNIDYRFDSIIPNNKNVLTVESAKKINPITKNSLNFFNFSSTSEEITVNDLNQVYDFADGSKAFYQNEEDDVCVLRDDYTILTKNDIYKISGIYKSDDVNGKNLRELYPERIEEIDTQNISSKNLNNQREFSFDLNNIDFKYNKNLVAKNVSGSIQITINNDSAETYDILSIKTGNVICQSNLINNKDEIFYSDINQSTGQFTVKIVNEDIIPNIVAGDILTNEDGAEYSIISYSAISKTIVASGTYSGNQLFLSTKGIQTRSGGKTFITFDSSSDLIAGDTYTVRYTDDNTPAIGTAFFVHYQIGAFEIEYLYVYDNLIISYEYGDNCIDWSISNEVKEGDSYFVSYEYGALREGLERNFANLVQVPYFQNFSLNKNREVFRDALEGALQSFSEGPTIPSIENVVESITKTKPEVKDRFFGNWILGRTHLAPNKIKYSGVLKFEPCKFDSGLIFDDGVWAEASTQSMVQQREGSISTWFSNKWKGIDNDADITVSLNNFGNYKFSYNNDFKYNSKENNFSVLKFIKQEGVVDDSEWIRITNAAESTPSYFGVIKKDKYLIPNDKLTENLNLKFRLKDISNHYVKPEVKLADIIINDGIRSLILENKAVEVKSLTGTITEPVISSYELEKKALTNKLKGNSKGPFQIFDLNINIKLSSIFNIQNESHIANSDYTNLDSKNLYVVNRNNYIYKITRFYKNNKVVDNANDGFDQIDVQWFPLNFSEEQNFDNIDAITFDQDFKIFAISSALCKEKNQSALVANHKENLLLNYLEENKVSILKDAESNEISISANKNKTSHFYSDLVLTDNIQSCYPSFLSDDIIELRKNKGFLFLIPNKNDVISAYINKLSYDNSRYFTQKDIFIGSKGYSPRNTKFSLKREDKNKGLMPFTEWGFYIGITDEKKDNIDIISDHWTVKSNLPPYLTLPEKVVVLGSSTITQLKNYTFELSINGNINVEGELSLASKI